MADVVQTPLKVPFDNHISYISAGDAHAALIGNQGALYTWGSNKKGQLGHSKTGISEVKLKATKVSCGFEYTICLTEDF